MIRGLTKNVYCAYTYRRSGQLLVMVPSSRGNIFTVAFIVPPPSSCHGTQPQHQRMQPHSYVILPTPNNQANKKTPITHHFALSTSSPPLCSEPKPNNLARPVCTTLSGAECLFYFILWYLINKNRQPFSVQVNCDHTGAKLKNSAHHETTNI